MVQGRISTLAHLRVPPANFTVMLQSPQEGVGRFVREEPLGEDDRLVFRVDADEEHEVHTVPMRILDQEKDWLHRRPAVFKSV